VPLWVPEVGGPIDPANEAHDMVMSVFAGMSKAERNRIKIRVRTAMEALARMEGRFLGRRPPYGYLLADAGPHPNPAKAADGKRLHRLDLAPEAAPVVRRIFALFLAGHGIYAIAEMLTRDGIPCPSAHDPGRNRYRCGVAWNKFAVRAILTNPRYTGHQVWNKQRKDEVLLDVDDVALGYITKMRWNESGKWIWSENVVHPLIIDRETFDQVQVLLAGRATTPAEHKPHRARRPYALRGCLWCGICERRMQSHWANQAPYYRCRFPLPLFWKVTFSMSVSPLSSERTGASGLRGWAYEDFVEGHAPGAGDGERDDFGDVLGGDRELLVHLLRARFYLGVGDVVGQLSGHGAGLDDDDADAGLQFLAQRFRPAVEAPLGGGVDGVAGAGGAASHRGQVDQVAAAIDELAEEDLGDGDGADQVGFDHASVVVVPLVVERGEQHDAGVVDQDVGPAEFGLDPVGGLDDGVAVGDVGLDGDGVVAELVGQGLDAVGTAGDQGQTVATGGECAGGGLADAGRCPGDDGDGAGALIGSGAHG